MSRLPSAVAGVLLVMPLLTGCETDDRVRANAPPQGYAEDHARITHYYVYHHDQGMIADMSISDMHFITHTSDLSGTGEARLGRYAELLALSGGIIHFDTKLRNEDMILARLASAREFLADSVPGARPVDVVVGLAGGPGMRSQEAAAGVAVAEQPEPRGDAYRLAGSGGSAIVSGG